MEVQQPLATLQRFEDLSPSTIDEAESYNKEAISLKIQKNYKLSAEAYARSAECYLKNNELGFAASEYINAANTVKSTDVNEYIRYTNLAIDLHLRQGNFALSANKIREIASVYQNLSNYDTAIREYERAAEIYGNENSPASVTICDIEIAKISIIVCNYEKAFNYFEKVSLENKVSLLTKLGNPSRLFMAGLCRLANGSEVIDYSNIDPMFVGSRQYKFLSSINSCVQRRDVNGFDKVVTEFDSFTSLDNSMKVLISAIRRKIV